MKLIISGVPCCGKTHCGDWLRDVHGFAHANLEGRQIASSFVRPPNYTPDLPTWLASVANNIVVTWGFPPNQTCIDIIGRFQAAGFVAWWFDADYHVARSRYLVRYGLARTENSFDPQIQRIAAASESLHTLYAQRSLTTLTDEGYMPLEQIRRTISE